MGVENTHFQEIMELKAAIGTLDMDLELIGIALSLALEDQKNK